MIFGITWWWFSSQCLCTLGVSLAVTMRMTLNVLNWGKSSFSSYRLSLMTHEASPPTAPPPLVLSLSQLYLPIAYGQQQRCVTIVRGVCFIPRGKKRGLRNQKCVRAALRLACVVAFPGTLPSPCVASSYFLSCLRVRPQGSLWHCPWGRSEQWRPSALASPGAPAFLCHCRRWPC